jgi:hypothetical protein
MDYPIDHDDNKATVFENSLPDLEKDRLLE